MSNHYVYQYLHPEYGHLYCGRTSNLDKRIYEHNNCKNDNISRKYKELLRESIVMYIELQNKAQEISVEAYCIDKYKPYLNKSLKYNNEDCMLEMKLPKWNVYNPQKLKYKQDLFTVKEKQTQIIEDISNIENDIKLKKDHLNKIKFDLQKINYEIKAQNNAKNNNVLFGFNLDDIRWFYKHCENKNVKFYSAIYDKMGNVCNSGCVYYDSDQNTLALKTDNFILTEEDAIIHVYGAALYNFYPDVNIYPELYAALLSKKDELSILNTPHDLKDLIQDYDDELIYSVDRNIFVEFRNGEIVYCQVILEQNNDIYKGVHNLPKYSNDYTVDYTWYKKDGISLVDERNIVRYKKENIDIGIKDYIFSCKYIHPNEDRKEENYCNKMISKYNK